MDNEEVLLTITSKICECGHAWEETSFIFRTDANAYSYDVSPERFEALAERRLQPVGYFADSKRVPVCSRCVSLHSLESGWPQHRGRHPHDLPHDFRWKEPSPQVSRRGTPKERPSKDSEKQLLEDLWNE
jgi:acetone carboxylase gamma subunit